MPEVIKPLTLRLPPDMYNASREIARRRKLSLNALIQESLAEMIAIEEQKRLYEEFSLVAEDLEEMDVSFAEAAQREVILSAD